MTCLGVSVFQTRLIYFPTREYRATPADVGLRYEALTLRTADGVAIEAWYLPHPEPDGTVLFCHGNAGNMSDTLDYMIELHHLGFAVLTFDYRGFGRSAGHPSERGTYLDAEAVWRYLTDSLRLPAERIVLFGQSLGGAVAIELADRLAESGPAALVVESTFTSLADVGQRHYPLLPVRLLLAHRYESVDKVGRISCPKLFIHGRDDELIPVADARRLYDEAVEPKTFVETPGGHSSAGFVRARRHSASVVQFLREATATDVQ
ncbi:MAG: alpha/beta hydrolase [Phycisphaerae bacterium]